METLNYFVALGTLALQVLTAGLLVAYFLRARYAFFGDIIRPIRVWAIHIGLAIVLFAAAVSLYYSDVLGVIPCSLCWWQRIFMYPQAVLFAMAIWLGDRTVTLYSIVLSVIGLAIGLYNHALQVLPSGALPCPAQGVSCAQRYLFEFGYITFPMLAVTLFAFLIVLMLIARARD